MKKLFVKITVATVFMVALFVNVSINAKKEAENTGLFGFISNANADCEVKFGIEDGKCLGGTTCVSGESNSFQKPCTFGY